jgi:hypothetical protein
LRPGVASYSNIWRAGQAGLVTPQAEVP